MSSSVRYEESSSSDFVRPVRSRAKGADVLVRLVSGIKQAGVHPSGTKSCDTKACPRLLSSRNHAGGTSSVRYEVARKECMSSSSWYMESSRRDYVAPVRNHARRASPRLSSTRSQQGRTSSVRNVVAQLEGTSSSIWYEESSMQDFVRQV